MKTHTRHNIRAIIKCENRFSLVKNTWTLAAAFDTEHR